MMFQMMLLAVLGICISIYTYITEMRLKKDPSYKPVCDLSDKISCSKPMQSEYGNILFVSNAIIGIIFYASMLILALINASFLITLGALASCIASCFLGYILYVKLQTICILCTALYTINFLMLIDCIKRMI